MRRRQRPSNSKPIFKMQWLLRYYFVFAVVSIVLGVSLKFATFIFAGLHLSLSRSFPISGF